MTLPVLRSFSELSQHAGLKIQLCGCYGVQSLGGHALKVNTIGGTWKKVSRSAHIKLSDDHFVALENRPDEEMEALDGLDVIVSGKLLIPTLPAVPAGIPERSRTASVPTVVAITAIEIIRIGENIKTLEEPN